MKKNCAPGWLFTKTNFGEPLRPQTQVLNIH